MITHNQARVRRLLGSAVGSISGQGRSGFETNVITKLDNIESKLGGNGGGTIPVEQPPAMPVGNLGGNLAQPDPVLPEPVIPQTQNAGGGGLAPVGGGMNPIADTSVNEPYQMPQSRSFI